MQHLPAACCYTIEAMVAAALVHSENWRFVQLGLGIASRYQSPARLFAAKLTIQDILPSVCCRLAIARYLTRRAKLMPCTRKEEEEVYVHTASKGL